MNMSLVTFEGPDEYTTVLKGLQEYGKWARAYIFKEACVLMNFILFSKALIAIGTGQTDSGGVALTSGRG